MSDILAEIDEQMRIERMQKIWHDHGKTLIGILAAILLVTAFISIKQTMEERRDEKGTAAMFALLDDETFPNNIDGETDLSELQAGHKTLLLLNAAQKYTEQEQPEEAIALYDRLINVNGVSTALISLAIIMRAKLQAGMDNADTNAILNDLEMVGQDSPYYAQASLERAVLLAGQNDYEKALDVLESVKNIPNLPQTLYVKAQSLEHVYQLRRGDDE
jgi:hypothetical protein